MVERTSYDRDIRKLDTMNEASGGLKILMGILTPSGGKIKISIVNLLGSFYPNKK